VKTAFLNYVTAAVEALRPTHVALNVEANILLAKAPDKWTAFKDFNAFVYTALKQRYPQLVVFSTIQYEHMLGLTEESRSLALQLRDSYTDVLEGEVRALLQHSDLVAISTYPFIIENNRYVRPDGRLDLDYYERAYALGRTLGKPVAFEQTGYISRDLYVASRDVTVPGSEAAQRLFVEHLLRDAHTENVAFVINFIGTDYGTAYGTSDGAMTWAYTGLWHEDGTPKAALASWDAYRAAVTPPAPPPIPDISSPVTFATLAARFADAARTARLPPAGTVDAPPSPELFIRWQQLASLLPEFEPPPADDPTSPWGFTEPYRTAAQATLARRELFLPYLQPLFSDFEATGRFALRLLSAADDPPLLMLGDWVLLAPVVEEGASTRSVHLPVDVVWIDWYTGQIYPGGQTVVVDGPLERMPIFIRMSN
jgi:hypothetical protein